MKSHAVRLFGIAFCLFIMLFVGCIGQTNKEVVVYCALDKEFSQKILDDFEKETGIRVLAKFDQESNKTVGLANEIIQQSAQQRCDVFWNNEILHTLRLKQQGVLAPIDIPAAANFPKSFVSEDSDWFGFAARARVLLVNTNLLPDEQQWPDSVTDLLDPKFRGKCAIAKPLFGTTATHAAVLYANLGKEKADAFFKQLVENAVVESGNKQVAINVSRGVHCFGLTDTDDAIIEVEAGHPVAMVFPDQGPEQSGTLFIPNTLAITRGPNQANASALLQHLLTPAIEEALAVGNSAQIPLHQDSTIKSRVEPENLKIMPVDFSAAAAQWEQVKIDVKQIFGL